MKYIRRALEERICQEAKTYKAILVTGARQVGKSTLLKQLFPDIKYITLDDPFVEEQAVRNSGMFMTMNQPPVIIDEVQRAAILFRYIKMKCDESDDRGLFYLSGSQQFHLMREVSESMSGRTSIIELAGLSLREISGDSFATPFVPTSAYIAERQKSAVPPDNIWEVIHRGSYPELQQPDVEWNSFYANYVKTYIERDVRELRAVQDLDSFRRFMVAAAARTGAILNYSNIADEIGKDVNTVKQWISILEASGIIYLLEPYSPNVLKRAIKTPKLYFRDTGLVCYLSRWLTPEVLAYGAMAGAIFETFAISEILKSFSNAGLDYRYFVSYYRGKDRKKVKKNGQEMEVESEIDFIIEENGILYPVEIKMNAAAKSWMTGAFPVLDKVPDKKRGSGAVICNCPQPGALRENIFQLPVWYI